MTIIGNETLSLSLLGMPENSQYRRLNNIPGSCKKNKQKSQISLLPFQSQSLSVNRPDQRQQELEQWPNRLLSMGLL